jgi:xylan 1,4-beta-xylosidase
MHGARRPRGKEEAEELGGWKTIQPYPCVDALAARDKDSFQVLAWNQMCDQYAEGVRDVCVRVEGLKDIQQLRVTEYRIDEHHSNAHTVWEQLGCPDWPDDEQIAAMRSREKLEAVFEDHPVAASGGVAEVKLSLPVHSVSLLVFELNGG